MRLEPSSFYIHWYYIQVQDLVLEYKLRQSLDGDDFIKFVSFYVNRNSSYVKYESVS